MLSRTAAVVALALLTACSGDGPTLSEVAESTSTTREGEGTSTTVKLSAEMASLPDPCALLPFGELRRITGADLDLGDVPPANPIGVPGTTRTVPARGCVYSSRDAADVANVTVRVGRPGDDTDRLLKVMTDHGERIDVPGAKTAVLQVNANTIWGLDGDLVISIQASYQGGEPVKTALPELLRVAVEKL